MIIIIIIVFIIQTWRDLETTRQQYLRVLQRRLRRFLLQIGISTERLVKVFIVSVVRSPASCALYNKHRYDENKFVVIIGVRARAAVCIFFPLGKSYIIIRAQTPV